MVKQRQSIVVLSGLSGCSRSTALLLDATPRDTRQLISRIYLVLLAVLEPIHCTCNMFCGVQTEGHAATCCVFKQVNVFNMDKDHLGY